MTATKNSFPARKILFFFTLFIFLSSFQVSAQERSSEGQDFWVSAIAESNIFSVTNIAFGGGAALGYGDGAALGLRVVYCVDLENLRTLELNFLVRLYLPRLTGHQGLFLQFLFGPAIFTTEDDSVAIPSQKGRFTAGLSLGWRFLLGGNFFLEPAVRGGYPYIAGLGLSAGLRF